MSTKSLKCQKGNKQWKTDNCKEGRDYHCPNCQGPLIAINRRSGGLTPEPVSHGEPAIVAQMVRPPAYHPPAANRYLPWAILGGGACCLLAVCLAGVIAVTSIGSNASDAGKETSFATRHRAEGSSDFRGQSISQKNQTRIATKRAWDAMQQIDNQMRNTKLSRPSQKIQTTAVHYSKVDLINVDQQLANHFGDMIAVYQQAARLHESLESEVGAINKKTEDFAKLTGFIGAIGSENKDVRKNAQGGALVGSVFAEIVQAKDRKKIKKKYTPLFTRIQSKLDRVNQQGTRLARTFSDRYRIPFIDLF